VSCETPVESQDATSGETLVTVTSCEGFVLAVKRNQLAGFRWASPPEAGVDAAWNALAEFLESSSAPCMFAWTDEQFPELDGRLFAVKGNHVFGWWFRQPMFMSRGPTRAQVRAILSIRPCHEPEQLVTLHAPHVPHAAAAVAMSNTINSQDSWFAEVGELSLYGVIDSSGHGGAQLAKEIARLFVVEFFAAVDAGNGTRAAMSKATTRTDAQIRSSGVGAAAAASLAVAVVGTASAFVGLVGDCEVVGADAQHPSVQRLVQPHTCKSPPAIVVDRVTKLGGGVSDGRLFVERMGHGPQYWNGFGMHGGLHAGLSPWCQNACK